MAIDPTGPSNIRVGSAEKAAELPTTGSAPSRQGARGDHVDISDAARSLAEQGAPDRVPFTEARVAEIADRLASGYYDRPEVRRAIAERIADSGDI